MKRMVLVALSFCLTAALFSSCAILPQEDDLPRAPVVAADIAGNSYDQVAVQRGDLTLKESVRATYSASDEESLSFSVGGFAIGQVFAQVGDEVHAGDLIAELYTDDVLEKIGAQEQVLAELTSEISFYKKSRELDVREEQLMLAQKQEKLAAGELSEAEYNNALADIKESAAEYQKQCDFYNEKLEIEQARLATLNKELESRRIYAGMNGTLRFLMTFDEKTIYTKDAVFAIIADYSSGIFTATVEAGDYFSVGTSCEINVNEVIYPLVVRSLEPIPYSKKCTLILDMESPNSRLKADDSGYIDIVVSQRNNVLYLPLSCVHQLSASDYVYCIDDKGVKSQVAVVTGLETGNKIEITSGLEEGTMVLK